MDEADERPRTKTLGVNRKPPVYPPDKDPWSREEAIAVMCRSLARLLEYWGYEGDAEAVRYAERALLLPQLYEVAQDNNRLAEENIRLRAENERLQQRIVELAQPKGTAPAPGEGLYGR